MPEQALGWFPLDLGLVVEDEPLKLSYTCTCMSCESLDITILQTHTVIASKVGVPKCIIMQKEGPQECLAGTRGGTCRSQVIPWELSTYTHTPQAAQWLHK